MTRHQDAPFTDLDIDEFLTSPQRKRIVCHTDTGRMMWRMAWRLYRDRQDLRRKLAERDTRIADLTGANAGEQKNWTATVAER